MNFFNIGRRTLCHTFSVIFFIISTSTWSNDLDQELSLKKISILVAVPHWIEGGYKKHIGSKNCHEYELPQDYEIPRGTLELVLLCRIIYSQGYIPQLKFRIVPSYARSIRMVELGVAEIAAETVWEFDINTEKLYFTEPIIRKGEFEKGLYVLKDHPVLKIPTEDFRINDYRGITVKNWALDWEVLSKITQNAHSAVHHDFIFNMMSKGHVDYALIQFPYYRDGLSLHVKGYELHPIPNVKVKLPASRHFIISKDMPNGEKIFHLLNKGIIDLRNNGVLEEYLVFMGVYNKLTDGWSILNEDSLNNE